jgi:hypothetical protein
LSQQRKKEKKKERKKERKKKEKRKKEILWSRILPEKLIVSQLLKFRTFYGTGKFITAFKKSLPFFAILSHITPVHISAISSLCIVHFIYHLLP